MFDDESFVAAGEGRVAQRVDLAGVASRRFVDESSVVDVVRADFVLATFRRRVAKRSPRTVVGMHAPWELDLFQFFLHLLVSGLF